MSDMGSCLCSPCFIAMSMRWSGLISWFVPMPESSPCLKQDALPDPLKTRDRPFKSFRQKHQSTVVILCVGKIKWAICLDGSSVPTHGKPRFDFACLALHEIAWLFVRANVWHCKAIWLYRRTQHRTKAQNTCRTKQTICWTLPALWFRTIAGMEANILYSTGSLTWRRWQTTLCTISVSCPLRRKVQLLSCSTSRQSMVALTYCTCHVLINACYSSNAWKMFIAMNWCDN